MRMKRKKVNRKKRNGSVPCPLKRLPLKSAKVGWLAVEFQSDFELQFSFYFTVLEYEKLYLENLPDAECYEKSYMHRDVITHVVATKSDFIITASIDGHVKFWKKMEEGIEFVKHFRSHLCKLLERKYSIFSRFDISTDRPLSIRRYNKCTFSQRKRHVLVHRFI